MSEGLFVRKSDIQLQSVVLKATNLLKFFNHYHRGDCVQCTAKINSQHSQVGVFTFKAWED